MHNDKELIECIKNMKQENAEITTVYRQDLPWESKALLKECNKLYIGLLYRRTANKETKQLFLSLKRWPLVYSELQANMVYLGVERHYN